MGSTLAATLAATVWLLGSLRSGGTAVGTAIGLATAWAASPLLVLLIARSGQAGRTVHDTGTLEQELRGEETEPGTVTVIVRFGGEPDEVARATVALAQRVGPVHVLTDGRALPRGLDEQVTVHDGSDPTDAVAAIATTADTDAVLLTSARAVPLPEPCRAAAGLLVGRVGWVVGDCRPFNPDHYVSDRRDLVGSELRRRCAAIGLLVWENDATLVRRDLLAEHALPSGRPRGSWLRDRATEGVEGARVDSTLSLRAAPVASGSFWPDTVARQRALAADLSQAARRGPLRARCAAVALVSRELYAWPLLVWLLMPALLVGGDPFTADAVLVGGALIALALLRWGVLRRALNQPLSWRDDVVAAIHHAPGSLAATSAALRGRIHRPRWALPLRPLVWGGLGGAVVAGYGLLGSEPGSPSSRLAALASLALLGMLWAVTIRSLVERTWERASFRVGLDLRGSVGGSSGHIVDGSPAGLAISVPADAPGAVGDEVDVTIELPATPIELRAVVAARRRRGQHHLLGLEIHPGVAQMEPWAAELVDAACRDRDPRGADHLHSSTAVRTDTHQPRSTVTDRLVIGTVVAASLAVLAILAVVLLGFRPMVIRTGSMLPAYRVGDVVLVDRVPVSSIGPGDVVTLDEYGPIGESMTHRVRSVAEGPAGLEVETRGDANDVSERWSAMPDQQVGRVVASIPAVGAPATLARTSVPALLACLAGLGLIVALVLRGSRRRCDTATEDSSGRSDGPTDTSDGSAGRPDEPDGLGPDGQRDGSDVDSRAP